MDGIVSGLTSITPIMPDQSIITDRNGMNRPPVEIMPLPTNSFMSEDATAELLNNPFTLSLDIKGYNDGDANGGKAVGRAAAQNGRTAPTDDALNGASLDEAYTLSLGNEENVPIAAEIAREMTRMKNYELLGKNATRQTYRMNHETGSAEDFEAQLQNNAPAELIREKVRSLLSQTELVPQNEVIVLSDIKTNLPQMRGVTLASPEMLPEETGSSPQASLPSVRQDMSLLASLASGRLSASDMEAILTLEPDLQEALLNMLSSINTSETGKVTADTPNERAGIFNTPTMIGVPSDNTATAAGTNQLTNAQQGIIRQTLDDIVRPPNAPPLKLTADLPDGARAVALSNEELARLTSDSIAGGKVLSAFSANTLRGSMQNLEKVNELPYALYIFGTVNPDSKGEFEEEGNIAVSEEPGAWKTKPSEFLRISEAIKMAAVLHNIYYGGSGRFPQETPWYNPYVRYAIKNGIIKNGVFGDYNELATRAETAYIFSGCVPKAEFPIINFVSDIPDVTESIGYGDSIYLLYRAGVLTKSRKEDSFYPESMITKTEAASIIGRIATPDDRKRFL